MPLTTDQYDALAGAVVLLLGRADAPDLLDQAKSAVYIVAQFARAYTRGQGFTDDGVAEDIQGVIITATARLVSNPAQAGSQSESGPILRSGIGGALVDGPGEGQGPVIADQSFSFSGGFAGWTEIEKAILHRYRVRNG
jgi:hypothetical protein